MADLPVVQLVASKSQDTIGDCGICALGTICGKSYEDVVVAAAELVGAKWKNGLYLTHMVKIAASFGVTLKRRKKYDLESACGILDVEVRDYRPDGKPRREAHVVVLMDGRIYDSDLRVWSPDAFISHYAAKVGMLLELM